MIKLKYFREKKRRVILMLITNRIKTFDQINFSPFFLNLCSLNIFRKWFELKNQNYSNVFLRTFPPEIFILFRLLLNTSFDFDRRGSGSIVLTFFWLLPQELMTSEFENCNRKSFHVSGSVRWMDTLGPRMVSIFSQLSSFSPLEMGSKDGVMISSSLLFCDGCLLAGDEVEGRG